MYVRVLCVCVISRLRVYVCVYVSRQATCVRSMCLCMGMLHGPRGYARGVVRACICMCMCVKCVCVQTALLDLGARMSEHHSCATSVCVCVRVRAGIVGDDALQTRVKSRGGREFLCASRPVFPLASPLPSAARQPPLAPLRYPLRAPSSSSLFSPSCPAYNRGRFESGSRWMRGTSRESGAAGGEGGRGRKGAGG